MKKLFSITLITCSSLLLIATACSQTQTTNLNQSTLATEEVSTESIQQTALAITVKITVGSNSGSGILIARSGNIYTVVTNAHVVGKDLSPKIKTVDGKTHFADIKKTDRSDDLDLVLLQFEAEEQYTVATLEKDRLVEPNQAVFVAGFADGEHELTFNSGKIEQISQKPIVGGYKIGFTNTTKQGMSGGALLNERGKVIGILGLGAAAILDSAYHYTDGSRPDAQMLGKLRTNSFAVPVTSLTTLKDLSIVLATTKPSQSTRYQGIVGQIDSIAEQITVKINSENNGNGSGVIVAQEDNTYYVVTAGHVVTNEDNYTIIVPDGESYPIKNSTIKTFEGVDLAVLQFTSQESYSIATLADYIDRPEYRERRFNRRIFISGFPDTQKERTLNAGSFAEIGNWTAEMTKDSYSLTNGNELLYTNLSLPGMSGGAVLDSQGKLIGINTGAENEYVETTTGQYEEVALGYSLGVPIKNFLFLVKTANIIPSKALQHDNSIPLDLTFLEINSIKEQLFKFKVPGKNATETDWLNYGNQLWRAMEDEEAVAAFDRAIAINPQEYRAYYGKGLTFALSLNRQQKIDALRQATKLAPNFYAAWQQLAATLSFDGESHNRTKLLESLPAYNRAIQLEPKLFTNYFRRGSVLKNLQRYDEAIADYNESLKLQPTPEAYKYKGDVYLELEQYQAAIDQYNRAKKLSTNEWFNTDIDNQIGRAYNQLGDYQSAIAILSETIEKKPQGVTESNLYGNRGIAYAKLKNYQAALADYNSALESYESYLGYLTRSLLYYELNDVKQGDRDFAKGLELLKEGLKRPLSYDDESNLQILATDFKNAGKPEAAQKIPGLISYSKAGIEYNKASDLLQSEKYREAIKFFTKAINIDPQLHYSYFSRGVAYYKLKEYRLALKDFNQGIKINPKHANSYFGRSVIYREFKNYQKALIDSNKAIALDPKSAGNYSIRGGIYYRLKQPEKAKQDWQKSAELYDKYGYEQETSLKAEIEKLQQEAQKAQQENDWESYHRTKEALKQFQIFYYLKQADQLRFTAQLAEQQKAIDFYTKVIELEPQNVEVHISRAHLYRQTKNYQKAIDDFNKVIELEPQNVTAYLRRGGVYRQTKNYQKAIDDFNKVIAINQEIWAYFRLAELYRNDLKDYQSALSTYKQAIVAHPDSDIYTHRADLYKELKEYQKAIDDYTKTIENFPDNSGYYVLRGNIYLKLEKYKLAIADYTKAIEIFPKSEWYYKNRAIAYLRLQDYPSAINDLNKAINICHESSSTHNCIAQLYLDRGVVYSADRQYQKAIADLTKVVVAEPKNARAYLNRGIVYGNSENYQKAIADLTKVVVAEPKNARAYFNRGIVYGNSENYQKALTDLTQVIEFEPKNARAYLNRGFVYRQLKAYQKALYDTDRAINLNPQSADAYLNRGSVYYSLNNYQKAQENWHTAAKLDKQQGNLQSSLKQIQKDQERYRQQGKKQDYLRVQKIIEVYKQF